MNHRSCHIFGWNIFESLEILVEPPRNIVDTQAVPEKQKPRKKEHVHEGVRLLDGELRHQDLEGLIDSEVFQLSCLG